jgi:hypothetical protein
MVDAVGIFILVLIAVGISILVLIAVGVGYFIGRATR